MKKHTWTKKVILSAVITVMGITVLPAGGIISSHAGTLTAEAASPKKFPDVTTFSEEIKYLTGLGIINGYPDGTFKPKANLTRLDAVRMVLREMNITDLKAPNPGFSDLKPGDVGYGEIAKAVEIGFINGKKDQKEKFYFDAKGTLTRAEMAKILTEAYNLKTDAGYSFKDLPSKHWAKGYVSRLASAGITNGYPGGTFKPQDSIERQHFATFMARLLNPAFKPEMEKPTPAPAKSTFVSLSAAHKHMMGAISPHSGTSKLFQNSGSQYAGTLLPSTDANTTANHGVVYLDSNNKHLTSISVITYRYNRVTAHLQKNGDKAIQIATEAVFGVNDAGAKQLNSFIKDNMKFKKKIDTTMTFGGHKFKVLVDDYAIDIVYAQY